MLLELTLRRIAKWKSKSNPNSWHIMYCIDSKHRKISWLPNPFRYRRHGFRCSSNKSENQAIDSPHTTSPCCSQFLDRTFIISGVWSTFSYLYPHISWYFCPHGKLTQSFLSRITIKYWRLGDDILHVFCSLLNYLTFFFNQNKQSAPLHNLLYHLPDCRWNHFVSYRIYFLFKPIMKWYWNTVY